MFPDILQIILRCSGDVMNIEVNGIIHGLGSLYTS